MTKQTRVWAYISSEWRKYSSDNLSEDALTQKLGDRGFLVEPFNRGNKPTKRPTRRQVLAAQGIHEEEVTQND